MGRWIQEQSWAEIYQSKDINEKANILQDMILNKLNEIFPMKKAKFTSDDQPWVTSEIK